MKHDRQASSGLSPATPEVEWSGIETAGIDGVRQSLAAAVGGFEA